MNNKNREIMDYEWKYEPIDRPFEQILDEFAHTFEKVSSDLKEYDSIILPLSGGLDSRTQASLLKSWENKVNTFSYSFEGGINESLFGMEISDHCGFEFQSFTIPQGYLWGKIEKLAAWNGCESEFTHPRQMAVEQHFEPLGQVFYLGHWGDVLFDGNSIDERANDEEQVQYLKSKILKKGGLELAEMLWDCWGFQGSFNEMLEGKLHEILSRIKISHAGAKIRAFKSLQWLPRWTMNNLTIFEHYHPVVLPYCDTRMFDLICSIPELHLDARKIQIEYIKRTSPELADIAWQPFRPYNLYNYQQFRSWSNIPRRIVNKIKRTAGEKILGKQLIQRNWELQFMGESNDSKLRAWLFENPNLDKWIPKKLVKEVYDRFNTVDPVYYSHSVSMLLTFSLYSNQYFGSE